MYSTQQDIFRQNHVILVEELDPSDVYDQLHEDGVLTENDYELIRSEKTRKERCRLLLTILPSRGPNAYVSFKTALKKKYPHLEGVFRCNEDNRHSNTVSTESNKLNSNAKPCSKCTPFLHVHIINPYLSHIIKQNCCAILDNVEANDILDLHYQELVLGRDQYERIKTGKTRKDRCVALVGELACSTNVDVHRVFRESLQKKYSYIVEMIDRTLSDESKMNKVGPSKSILSEVIRQGIGVGDTVMKVCSETITYWEKRNKDTKNDDTLDIIAKPEISMSKIPSTDTCKPSKHIISEVIRRGIGPGPIGTPMTITRQQCTALTASEPNISNIKLTQSAIHQSVTCLQVQNKCSPITKQDSKEHVQQTRRRNRKRGRKRKNKTSTRQAEGFRDDTMSADTRVAITPGAVQPCSRRCKRLEATFNSLSTLINQGNFSKFEHIALKLERINSDNVDLMCVLNYLYASRYLFVADVDSAKKHIGSGLELAQMSSNAKYFILEFLTARTRKYIIQHKLEKLQRTLDDAKMAIHTDPVGCSGRAAGWLYLNDVKTITIEISMLSTHNTAYTRLYNHLQKKAKESCQKALAHFKQDGSRDGPFGFGFAMCKFVILLLQCGENGLKMGSPPPDSEDIKLAGDYLRQLENSEIPISTTLRVPYLLAKCDYHFRCENTVRALEYSETALKLATEFNLLEFNENARNRVVFLKRNVDEEDGDVLRMLFGDL